MKKRIGITVYAAIMTVMLTAAGCTSAVYLSSSQSYGDDMYGVHDVDALARQEQQQREKIREAEAKRRAQINQMIADAQAEDNASTEIDDILRLDDYDTDQRSYSSVLADDYESAYERRLRGFSSSTYNMPASYYAFRYGLDYPYVVGYDPMFYNVMVMGDQVWVEPKYVSAMFGTWGRPSFSLSLGWGMSWYDSYYWDMNYWDWHSPYYSWYSPYYSPHHYWDNPYWGGGPHYGPGRRDPNMVYRPSFDFNRRENSYSGSQPTGRPSSGSGNASRTRVTESYRSSGDSNNSSTRVTRGNESTRSSDNRQSVESTRNSTSRTERNDTSTRTERNDNATRNNNNNSSTRSNSNSNNTVRSNSSSTRVQSSGGGGGAVRSGGGTSHSGAGGGRR